MCFFKEKFITNFPLTHYILFYTILITVLNSILINI